MRVPEISKTIVESTLRWRIKKTVRDRQADVGEVNPLFFIQTAYAGGRKSTAIVSRVENLIPSSL